ncbi:MAG: bifunctional rhamnulose-1-phosphate aldolase/short-chain dehydrogenase [Phycisphaerae bacterium]|nr:bifunctional rhamnulose-1-phosphate aldolase/short-chain dehydrogenase [Phycisphaerae bacterium]MDW8262072.1 bifunctional rhamnulose-1-phosphate aldolase/short-chain dehydrogenase [Phycisphaerales bacterium]
MLKPFSPEEFKFVRYLWDDAKVPKDPVERLVWRSNLLGSDQRITNTGGGNTSSKVVETDPITGEKVDVLWVKGSGGDLRTSNKGNFASLYLSRLLSLETLYKADPNNGPKTAIEDKMVELYPQLTFNLNPRASSIDTPLHGFLPARCVDHTHPNAVIAIAASKNGAKLCKEVFGDAVEWTCWQRPGFDLGLVLREITRKNPKAVGVVLGGHGLINWANDDKSVYELSLTLIEKAARYISQHDKGARTFGGARYQSLDESSRRKLLIELLPWLRGQVSVQNRFIATVETTPAVLEFVNSEDAPRLAELGTSCPDHFLRTKIKPLYVDFNPQKEDLSALKSKLQKGLERYRADYRTYYEQCRRPDSPAMRDPNPTVILIPGVGMIAWGKDKSESRVTAEFYNCAIQVMRGAEAIDQYTALPQQEAFDIEYWQLEEAKLRRMPPEKEFARRVVAVIGAGSGIGRQAAHRLAAEGAHIVAIDLDESAAKATADELGRKLGQGIGVAGTGISGCGPAIGLAADVTRRESIRTAFEQIILAYGGFDHAVITSGVFVAPDETGNIPDDKWALSFAVNVTGAYLATKEAQAVFDQQNLPECSVVITTSVNAVVAKKGSVAYDTSKAAANHLVRELAMELAPAVRVNGVAPATVVAGSSMFPRDRVIASLAKYKLPYDPKEDTETLRDRLAGFYAQRTLLKAAITPEDQAEAIWFLLSRRSGKTTGQIINVDGGLHEAFLR